MKQMKKWLACALILALLCAALSGCTMAETLGVLLGADGEEALTEDAILAEDGYAEGELGDTLRNVFFEFTVTDARYVTSYAGYAPASGMKLVDVTIEVANISRGEIPMFDTDFQIQWGDGDYDYGYCLDALDDTMLPTEYTLERGGSSAYHAVYEVPEDTYTYAISYMELFADDTEGDVFFVYFELPANT